MNMESDPKNPQNNTQMIDEKEELLADLPICVEISCGDERNPPNPDEIIVDENGSKPEKESEKNHTSEHDKSLTIIKITGIPTNPLPTAQGKKGKNNGKIGQIIRKPKNKKGVKSTKCNICRKGKELISCKKCPKSFHLVCIQLTEDKLPKTFLCPKCKDKVRIQKKRYRERLLKKKQQTQQAQNQTEADNQSKEIKPRASPKPAIDKGEKAKNDKRKKFEEFAKKYPKFVVDGRVKYPIEDKLLQIYGCIFNDGSKAMIYKPSPKSCLIPSEHLGDILQITNFFHSFSDILQNTSFTKDELYTALNYNGDQVLEIINELHMDLLNLILRELFEKNKFEEFKENNPDSTSFVFLLKALRDLRNFEEVFGYCWTEVLSQIPEINLGHKFDIPESVTELFRKIGEASYMNYNKLAKEEKIKALLALIDIIYETDIFKEIIDKKMEEYNSLYKERNDLQLEIKQDENALHELEAQINELENLSSQLKNNASTSRQEALKKMKENENELKELNKLQANQTKLIQQISKKKNRYEKIQKELPFFMNSMVMLGQDVNKIEYWFLMTEDDKIFVRYPPSQKEDEVERWYILDTKEEVDQLLSALNTKGIKEKGLHDTINLYIKSEFLIPHREAEQAHNENSTTSLPKTENMSEILANLLNSQSINEIKQERNTRGRPKKSSPQTKKLPMTLDVIISKILQTETYFNNYLFQRSSRWILEEEKPSLLDELKNTKDLTKLMQILGFLNESFCNVEYLYFEEEENSEENKENQDQENEEEDDEMYYSMKKKPKKSTIDLESQGNLCVKKINLRIWGFYNEKVRKSWFQYISSQPINLISVYVATIIFCDFVSKYVTKKLVELDSSRDNEKNSKREDKKPINLDSYKYVSNNDQIRAKQEKMNELLNGSDYLGVSTRRTTRKHMLVKNSNRHVSNEREWEWEEDCNECGEGGEVLCCDTCPSVYHLKCVGLKEVPEGKWNCYECLQKLQTQRHTRAISKKFNIDDS